MRSDYLIADILISVKAPYILKDTEEFALYRSTSSSEKSNTAPCCGMDTEKEDSAAEDEQVHRNQYYEICLVADAGHPPLEGRPLFQNEMNLYLEKDGKTLHFFSIPLTHMLSAWCETTGPKSLTIHYQPFAAAYFRSSLGCFNAASFENVLFTFGKYIFHCSYIDAGGEAVLFSAHSGGGKTTHGLLWEKTGLGEMINGDRAIIEKKHLCPDHNVDAERTQNSVFSQEPRRLEAQVRLSGYMVHGLPIAGSSRVFKNRTLPLKAIFMLEKASVNEVVDLSPSKQFLKVFEQLTIHTWDREFVNAATAFTVDLIQHVPVKLLRCRPDSEAVEAVREALTTYTTVPHLDSI